MFHELSYSWAPAQFRIISLRKNRHQKSHAAKWTAFWKQWRQTLGSLTRCTEPMSVNKMVNVSTLWPPLCRQVGYMGQVIPNGILVKTTKKQTSGTCQDLNPQPASLWTTTLTASVIQLQTVTEWVGRLVDAAGDNYVSITLGTIQAW